MTQATPKVQDHALEHLSDKAAKDLEDSLWWVHGRKAIIRKYLERALQGVAEPIIMDVGCGSGGNLQTLSEFGSVLGVEPSPILARRSRERGIAKDVFEADVGTLDSTKSVDVFTMFDVLEHIEDDLAFLGSIRKQAEQKHTLLVSVPACPQLYGEHDRILHHYRRYNRAMLSSILEKNGYKVEAMSYHMTFLFPVALAVRLKDKVLELLGYKRAAIELGDAPPLLSRILGSVLMAESSCVGHVSLPCGLWLFALATSEEK